MSRFEIECRPCGASLLTPLLSAVTRFDEEHRECASIRESLERGLAESAAGDVHDLGSFAAYADEESY